MNAKQGALRYTAVEANKCVIRTTNGHQVLQITTMCLTQIKVSKHWTSELGHKQRMSAPWQPRSAEQTETHSHMLHLVSHWLVLDLSTNPTANNKLNNLL
jgi:hypothetical protein